MSKFNKDFYTPNRSYTLQDAERVMIENGYEGFCFKGCSFSNGASFYFDVDGKEVRVSDHPLTGSRAFDTVQLSLCKVGTLNPFIKPLKNKNAGVSGLMKRVYKAMLKKGAITEDEYNNKING